MVGIGDLTAVPSSDYPVGIAVAIPLPKHVIKDLQLAPTREYYKLYTTLNDKLNAIVTAGEKISDRQRIPGLCPDNRPDNSRLRTTAVLYLTKLLPPEPASAGSAKLSACNTTIWLCCKDFFSSDRCPADLRCSGYTLSVRCLSCLRPVLPGTCTEKYIVAFGYATRRYRICFCML